MLERIILGEKPIPADQRRDNFLLTGYFLLLYIGIDIFFLFVNLFNPNGENIPILIGLGISVSCLVLLRKGWRNTAILIQLVRTNAIAFIFISLDHDFTGNFFYYIVSGIGAMALYGYEERWKGISFSAASLLLFYVSVLNVDQFTPSSPHFYLIMNFTIAYVMAFIIIYFLNKLTFLSQSVIVEKNNQLEKVNSELDRFVYSVSHDLRAPLSSISGLIQLIEKTTDPKETEQYLNLMKGRIERLEQFIRDIINFSRNARSDFEKEEVKLKELVLEIFQTLKFINGADTIILEENLDEALVVTTDKTRLQIVLFNLISNAIQYRDPNKNPSYIKLSCSEMPSGLLFHIDDNGIGIDYPHHAKIFDMFYRASTVSKGSGLGLYIVKETMEKLGGSITLHSVPGQGTRFTLELPVQRSQ